MIQTKEESKVSSAIWIPLAWFFIVSTRSVSRWMNLRDISTVASDIEGGNALDSIVLSALILLGIFVLMRRGVNWPLVAKYNKWILLLFIYMGLSIVWSNFAEVTIRRWFRSTGTLIMVLVALTEAYPLEGISAVLRRCFYVHLPLSIITIKYFRNIGVDFGRWGREEMWIGLTMHKNNLGQIAMISGLYFTWRMMKNWGKKRVWVDFLFILMSLWLLRGSGESSSKTGILGFAIGVGVLLMLQHYRRRVSYLGRYAFIWILILGSGFVFVQSTMELLENESVFSSVIEATGRDVTLTDRTLLWHDILENASKNPLLGVGYGAFWVGDMGDALYPLHEWTKKTPGWRPNEGHDGFIDAYVELGVIGLSLLLIAIMAAVRKILYLFQTDFEYAKLSAVLLVVILLNNITESSLLKGSHSLWFLFLLIAVGIPRTAGPRALSKT